MPVLPRRGVDPHSIAHRKGFSKAARAVLGAEILDGNVVLMNPTIEMTARALGVSVGYVSKARQLPPDARREVARGARPLVRPKAPPAPVSVEERTNALVARFGVSRVLSALATLWETA
jgi:hypothetical protein